MPNMKALSLTVKKLYSMLKFADGQTDRQTDRVITIGHPPSGGALMKIHFRIFLSHVILAKTSENLS